MISLPMTRFLRVEPSPQKIHGTIKFRRTSKSPIFVQVNIMIPDENGEYLEKPVVEQFRTYWDPKKKILITEPVEIAA